MHSARQVCELFHYAFLEQLLRISSAELYVLKGGVNLRFFFGSPRYSEDMDLDVVSGKVAVETLRKNGYRVLDDRSFVRRLQAGGIDRLEIGDPRKAKHTSTTQRFRVGLVLPSGARIPTKIEFSRRGKSAPTTVETRRVDAEIARLHERAAFLCCHYQGEEAAAQKLQALAGRSEPQARDLFDLFLLASRGHDLEAVSRDLDPTTRAQALENVHSMTFEQYSGQVVEYLVESERKTFASAKRFGEIQSEALRLLETT